MVNDNRMAIIASRPSLVRDSLQDFLLTLPQIEIVIQVGDESTALKTVREHNPTLVILDADLPGNGLLTALESIKATDVRSQLLVLVNDRQQQQVAKTAGADLVLIKGYPATNLYEDLKKLMSEG